MKLYNSVGPNPQVVRMFIAEKGLDIPKQEVDLMGGENRRPPFNSTVNVAGQLPALGLDNGKTISEITAICEYLEEVGKGPALIGATPEERAETRMWVRRIDLNICEPMANGFRAAEGRAIFANRIKLVGADGAKELKEIARDRSGPGSSAPRPGPAPRPEAGQSGLPVAVDTAAGGPGRAPAPFGDERNQGCLPSARSPRWPCRSPPGL